MRNTRIDFLRGLSILAVLTLHYSLTYDLPDSPLTFVLPRSLIRACVVSGNYGVTLFFVISGYLITSNALFRYGGLATVNPRHFYTLRAARIFPPLLLALTVIVTLGVAGAPSFANTDGGRHLPDSFFLVAVLSVLTFWHNVLMQTVGYFNYCLNIYWSLSVEETFYLLFPVACRMLRSRGAVAVLCAAAIIAGPIYRHQHRDDELFYLYGYLACFDAIAFGCLAALAGPSLRIGAGALRGLRLGAGCGAALVYLAGIEHHETFGFSALAFCGACLMLASRQDAATRVACLPQRAVAWLGSLSYELYLFHIIVLGALRDLWPRASLPNAAKLPLFLVFLSVSTGVAAVVARCYAAPSNRWLRSRFSHLPATLHREPP